MGKDSIRVCARFRPQNKLEKSLKCHRCIQISDCKTVVQVKNPAVQKPYQFILDHIFDTNSSQPHVFNTTVKEFVTNVMMGFNCTVFAYGQTGTGKTYSMEGELGSPSRGIIPRVVEYIFQLIEEADEVFEFVLKISYCEIYLEKLRDLLNPKNKTLKIRENKAGIYIQGITEMYVRDEKDVMNLMILGGDNRTVQGTRMNAVSSRSHAVFMLKLISKHTETGSTKLSKLMMVDLAGSEKVGKTEASGSALEEAKKINQSLSALGNVMNALTEGTKHIPYRDSVLTKLLSDSLGGNCKTCLLIAASCSSYSAEETVSTMRFGVRAKKIKNTAKVNAEKTVAEYKKEVIALNKTIKDLKKLVACLKHDLDLSKKGELTEENELAAKLERGEKVVLKLNTPEEEKEAPKEVTFGGMKTSSGKKPELKESPKGDSSNNTGNSPAVENKPVSPQTSAQGNANVMPRMKEQNIGGFPAHIKPTADGGIFNIGDRIADDNGRLGIVQRVFYVEDVDVRWDNQAVTYKIPATRLSMVELDGQPLETATSAATVGDDLSLTYTAVNPVSAQTIITKSPEAGVDSESHELEKVASERSEAGSPGLKSEKAVATQSESDAKVESKECAGPFNKEDGQIPPLSPVGLSTKSQSAVDLSNTKPDMDLISSPKNSSRAQKNDSESHKNTRPRLSSSRNSNPASKKGDKNNAYWAKFKMYHRLVDSLQKEMDGLKIERNKLKETNRQIINRIQTVETESNIKGEAIQRARVKTEEAEAEFTKAILKLRTLEDTHSTVTYEKKKLEREVVELNQVIENQEKERGKLKAKMEMIKNEAENEMNKVRQEEKLRAKKFIEAAQKAINRSSQPVKRLMRENERMQRNRTKQSPNKKSQEGNERTSKLLKEMQTLKLDQLKLEQDLSSKVKDHINLTMKLAEREDQLLRLQNDVMNKDLKLKHQHEELTAFGKLKIESDKYHRENAARDQERITKLKREIKRLKRKRDAKKGNLSKSRQKKMRAVVIPLKGGGGKKKKRKSGKKKDSPTGSVASSYVSKKNTGAQAYASPYTMNDEPQYYSIDCGSEYKQMDVDDVGSQISYGSYSGAYYTPGVRAPKLPIYGEEVLPDLPPEDFQSVVDGSVSGYGCGSHYDSQSMYQDSAYTGQKSVYGYNENTYLPYGGNAYVKF